MDSTYISKSEMLSSEEVKTVYPSARHIVEVFEGWIVFFDEATYKRWKNQK